MSKSVPETELSFPAPVPPPTVEALSTIILASNSSGLITLTSSVSVHVLPSVNVKVYVSAARLAIEIVKF